MKKIYFFCILVFLILTQSVFCEKILFSARNMSGRAGSKDDTTELAGNANVITETIEVKADSIQLTGKEFRYVSANGNINGIHKESNLEFSADALKYDRETKVVTLSGDVKLYDIDNDARVAAQIIEYDTNSEIAILQIGVKLEQKKNVCTSAYAVYRKKEQMLEMNGNAKVVQDDDTFGAQAITFNMDTEEILMEGNVHGSVTDDKKSDDENSESESESETEAENNEQENQGEAETDTEAANDEQNLEDGEKTESGSTETTEDTTKNKKNSKKERRKKK